MSYMWDDFNIKTWPAETIVFRDGVFCPELSTLAGTDIDQTYDLPVHVIYVGEIAGKCRLNLNISAQNQDVVISARIKNKKPAFLHIFIKNTGKNSAVRGKVFMENDDNLEYDIECEHGAPDTTIEINTKILANAGTKSKLYGVARIEKNCTGTVSDISFSALAAADAKLEFMPAQYISAAPRDARHSADIYRPKAPQILYLRQAGLDAGAANRALREAFLNE